MNIIKCTFKKEKIKEANVFSQDFLEGSLLYFSFFLSGRRFSDWKIPDHGNIHFSFLQLFRCMNCDSTRTET